MYSVRKLGMFVLEQAFLQFFFFLFSNISHSFLDRRVCTSSGFEYACRGYWKWCKLLLDSRKWVSRRVGPRGMGPFRGPLGGPMLLPRYVRAYIQYKMYAFLVFLFFEKTMSRQTSNWFPLDTTLSLRVRCKSRSWFLQSSSDWLMSSPHANRV